jgi:ATP-binding cassette subfamily B protein
MDNSINFNEIMFDYIIENKKLVTSFILVGSLIYIIRVIVLSSFYSKFMKDTDNFKNNLKNVMYIWICLCILYVIKNKVETQLYSDVLFHMRNTMYAKYIKYNYHFFNDKNPQSDVIVLFDAARVIRDIFYFICQQMLPTLSLMIGINIYMLIKYPQVGMMTIFSNFINYQIIKYFSQKLNLMAKDRWIKLNELINKVNENLGNLMDIFINNKVDDSIKKYFDHEKEYQDMHRKEFNTVGNFTGLLKANNYANAFISLYLIYSVSDKKELINNLLLYTFYMSTIQEISEDIPRVLTLFGNLDTISNKLKNKFSYHEYVDLGKNIINPQGRIIFDNITFSYDDSKKVIENFSLEINPGEKIGIFAQSGSGKTTLIKLLLKLYRPQKGNILFDGENINELNTKDLRKEINYINQRTILFNDTLINNIRYGNNKSDEYIIKLLEKYELNEILGDVKQTIDLNGTNMSMGMQKIIFLVRGIIRDDCSVYVFDEPLTSLDPRTRLKVMNMIKNEIKNKTTIIISHDQEITSILDRNIKLN